LVPELIVCNGCEHEHIAHKYNVYMHILYVVAVVDNIGKTNFERLLMLQTSDISAHVDEHANMLMPKLNKIKEIYFNNKF
jgi:hypothetical protein